MSTVQGSLESLILTVVHLGFEGLKTIFGGCMS